MNIEYIIYYILLLDEYNHLTVNHSENFIDPLTEPNKNQTTILLSFANANAFEFGHILK